MPSRRGEQPGLDIMAARSRVEKAWRAADPSADPWRPVAIAGGRHGYRPGAVVAHRTDAVAGRCRSHNVQRGPLYSPRSDTGPTPPSQRRSDRFSAFRHGVCFRRPSLRRHPLGTSRITGGRPAVKEPILPLSDSAPHSTRVHYENGQLRSARTREGTCSFNRTPAAIPPDTALAKPGGGDLASVAAAQPHPVPEVTVPKQRGSVTVIWHQRRGPVGATEPCTTRHFPRRHT
jgi:hypothetical protein